MSSDAGWRRLAAVEPTAGLPLRARCGDEAILIFETASGLRGAQPRCPHADYSLVHAQLVEGERLRCAFHGFTFRLSDGRGVNCPGVRLAVYEITEDDGALCARRVP